MSSRGLVIAGGGAIGRYSLLALGAAAVIASREREEVMCAPCIFLPGEGGGRVDHKRGQFKRSQRKRGK